MNDQAYHHREYEIDRIRSTQTLRVRTEAGELRLEVPALAHPEVDETIAIGAAKFALWAFADRL